MHSPLFRSAGVVFIGCAVLINAVPSKSQEKAELEVVRLTYTHGEVKFSPGKNGRRNLATDWIAAPAGMTLEAGDTLATEDGRAAMEFEDGSAVYLAEHSVLQFGKLQIKEASPSRSLHFSPGSPPSTTRPTETICWWSPLRQRSSAHTKAKYSGWTAP